MSTIKTKKVQVGTDSTASNNFTIYTPGTPDGTVRIGNGNADSPTEVGRFDANGYAANNIQIGTDATSSNNFTIYQPATPDGTLRIGVGNADSPTEVGRFTSAGYKPATAPAFSALKSGAGNQSISASTATKVTFPNEQWDLTSDYDTATSRFTPSVSGYYQFNSSFYFLAPVDGGVTQIQLYKNGSAIKYGNILTAAGTQSHSPLLSATVYANGTTDYFEIYIWQNSGTKNIDQAATLTWFDGILIQQA